MHWIRLAQDQAGQIVRSNHQTPMTSNLRIYSAIGTVLFLLGSSTPAAIFNIANGDVAGLANAITTSNTNVQDDTIVLAAAGTYTLTTALPQIGADSGHKLTIQGSGATIDGNSSFRIFATQSGSNVAISGLTMANGNPGALHGGAILANVQESAASTLTIDNCIFNNNRGDYGGAIFNDGYNDPNFPPHTATLTVTGSTFFGNVAQHGGAIWNESGSIIMDVSNCTFSQNTASPNSAGAIQVDGSAGTITASITNSTFSQNSAGDFGGAISVDGAGGFDFFGNPVSGSAALTITNCTFDRNTAQRTSPNVSGFGGAIAMDGSTAGGTSGNATVTVNNCTFSGNFSSRLGDAIYLSETTSGTTVLQIGNSILASGDPDFNISTDNISGGTVTVTSNGNNLSDDAACGVDPCNDAGTGPGGLLNHVGDKRNTNPLLDPAGLLNNGGPTQTIALQPTSPAINAGNDATAPGRDQRYYTRSGISDIGAFELGGQVAPIHAGSTKTHGAAGAFAVDFPLTGPVGVESRTGGPNGNHQLAMSFATPVTLTGASVQSGVGTVSGFTPSGSQVTVNLTGVANAQQLVVRLANVNDGVTTNNVDIPMDVLAGDTNADHFVDAIDTAQTKSKSGQAINSTNFREDVNVDGFLDAIDVALVKSKAGTALTAPTLPPSQKPVQRRPRPARGTEVSPR